MKMRSIGILLVAEFLAMSLWFVSAAIVTDLVREVAISPARQAALSSAVQAGFVTGALLSAVLGLADRFDPRRTFAVTAIAAGVVNLGLVVLEPGGVASIGARFLVGALLAGVYPIGMKIAVGWGQKDRGFLVGALVGALTLGSAAPHLLALLGGAHWRLTVTAASIAAIIGGLLALAVRLGPHHALSPAFDPRAIWIAWTNPRVRWAYAGYFGHMWELYAMWAWIGAATAVSYQVSMSAEAATTLAKITAFVAIGAGAAACVVAGRLGDRFGKAEIATGAMIVSGLSAVLVAATFGGAPSVTFVLVVLWGASIVPDSAQFSALVADAAPAEFVGSLLTLQTALGFALTIATVQVTPLAASWFGWPAVIATLAIGPAFGVYAMGRLRGLGRSQGS